MAPRSLRYSTVTFVWTSVRLFNHFTGNDELLVSRLSRVQQPRFAAYKLQIVKAYCPYINLTLTIHSKKEVITEESTSIFGSFG